MALNKIDVRQIASRDTLSQLTGVANSEGDNLFRSIDTELTAPLRLSANSPANLIVNIGPAIVSNTENSRNRSIPHIGTLLPNSFSSGTITFPAASGGNIICSPGGNTILNVSSGNFIKVLIYLDSTGAVYALAGTESAVEANATVLPAPKKTLPIGYITLQNIAGVIQNVAQNKVYQFGTGGASSGSGDGSGLGSDLASLTFKAEINEDFDDVPTDVQSSVDVSVGKTDATTYSATDAYYRLAYDATKTVTGTGTSMTISLAPSFTVKAGDILRVGNEVKKINTVTTQTQYVVESAFLSDPTALNCVISQAVHTKDLNNTNFGELSVSDSFSTPITKVLVDYEDTTALNDSIFDINTVPVIAFSVSTNGTVFSNASVRPQNTITQQNTLGTASGTSLYLRFFSNKTTGSGFVNILKYHAYFHKDELELDADIRHQAFCKTNSTGTPINCSNPSVIGGKTTVITNFSFPTGINPGTTNGAISVYLNGQKLPRYVDAVLTPFASYTELNQNAIQLDSDYSANDYELEIIQNNSLIDVSQENTLNITKIKETITAVYTAIVGSPAQVTAGIATHSSITSAIAAVSNGQSILVLAGTYTENVNLNKRIKLEGQGYDSFINGTFSFSANNSVTQDIRINGNITISGNGNRLEGFQLNASTVTDSGIDNVYSFIGV